MRKSKAIIITLSLLLLSSCGNKKEDYSSFYRLKDGSQATRIKNGYRVELSSPAIMENVGTVHGCTEDGTLLKSKVIQPFNTVVYLDYYITSARELTQDEINSKINYDLVNDFKTEMVYDHALFDRHYYYFDDNKGKIINNIKTLNASYGKEGKVYDERLYKALKKGLSFSLASKEHFNMGVGALSALWDYMISWSNDYNSSEDYIRENYYSISQEQKKVIFEDPKEEYLDYVKNITPSNEELNKALVFDDDTNTITFNSIKRIDDYVKEHKDLGTTLTKLLQQRGTSILNSDETLLTPSLTLGGFGKGEATEIFHKNHPDDVYYVNGGTSSIVAQGMKPNGNVWEFTLANPLYSEEQQAHLIRLDYSPADYALSYQGNLTLSTSGYYQNYFYVKKDGKFIRRDHIVDSDRNSSSFGYSKSFFGAASAITEDAGYGDMYTTTLMNCSSLAEAKEVLASLKAVTGTIPDVFYQCVNEDGKSLTLYVEEEMKDNFLKCNDVYPSYTIPSVTELKTI